MWVNLDQFGRKSDLQTQLSKFLSATFLEHPLDFFFIAVQYYVNICNSYDISI